MIRAKPVIPWLYGFEENAKIRFPSIIITGITRNCYFIIEIKNNYK